MSLPPNLVFVADTPEPKPIVSLYRLRQTKLDQGYENYEDCNSTKSKWVTAQGAVLQNAEMVFKALVDKLKVDNNIGAILKPGCWEEEIITKQTDIIGGVIGGILGIFMGTFMNVVFGKNWKQDLIDQKLKEIVNNAEAAEQAEAAFKKCCTEQY